MPTVNTRNIMVGAGHLYISTNDRQEPMPVTAPAAGASIKTVLDTAPASPVTTPATSAFRYVGATDGGVEVTFSPDIGEVEVDQLKDSALIFNTGQSMSVGTSLAEPTLANLLVSWGFASSQMTGGGDTLNIPAMPDDMVERSIVLVGNAPRGSTTGATKRERTYYGRRCVSVEGGAHTLSRTEAATLPIMFRMLPDTTAPAGAEYGTIVDRTI